MPKKYAGMDIKQLSDNYHKSPEMINNKKSHVSIINITGIKDTTFTSIANIDYYIMCGINVFLSCYCHKHWQDMFYFSLCFQNKFYIAFHKVHINKVGYN